MSIITAATEVTVLLEHLSRLADLSLIIYDHNITNNGNNLPFIINPLPLQP
jgi:hypothetical protein